MRVGVVSDTHNNLTNVRKIVALFNAAQVDRVVHTGDITKATTLGLFADLRAEVFGVFGNNDLERDSLDACIAQHGFSFFENHVSFEWQRRTILVVHDPKDVSTTAMHAHDLVLHGHTHMQRIESLGNTLVFNPGECAGHMVGFNSIGVVDLTDLGPQILKF